MEEDVLEYGGGGGGEEREKEDGVGMNQYMQKHH